MRRVPRPRRCASGRIPSASRTQCLSLGCWISALMPSRVKSLKPFGSAAQTLVKDHVAAKLAACRPRKRSRRKPDGYAEHRLALHGGVDAAERDGVAHGRVEKGGHGSGSAPVVRVDGGKRRISGVALAQSGCSGLGLFGAEDYDLGFRLFPPLSG